MDDATLNQIARYIADGRCALFVGPDLGESAGGYRGLPTSWQLADELASTCGYRGRFRSLPQVAQIYARRLGRQSLIEYIRERLSLPEYRPLPVHELIARIPFMVIVDGGWDTLLEQALRGQGVHFQIIHENHDLPFVHPGQHDPLLFKPYGAIDMPASLRITEDDQFDVFYSMERVVARLREVIEQYVLLLVGYTLTNDAMFVRIYHEMRQVQQHLQVPAFTVQSLFHPEESAIWDSYGIVTITTDEPAVFLRDLAEAVARIQGRPLQLPDPASISMAARLTAAELEQQAAVLNSMMDQLGVADLVEQTDVPLLSSEQLRDIEAMRAAYQRLTQSFGDAPGSARVWLRQGNLEYARGNYQQAEVYYRRALESDATLADAHHNLHFVLLARGDRDGAMSSYRQAIALQPDLAILPNRYEILGVLGSGGLGVVYHAQDIKAEQVAVKVLQRGTAQNERALNIFRREAEVLRRLDHPAIVRMLEFNSYGGNYFIVMEYIKGQSLKDRLAGGPLSLDTTYMLVEQICGALAHAHAAGVIHRDLKPSNVLLVGDHAKLIDFGLARPAAPGELTVLGVASGTVGYMAPELALGLAGDARTDVFGVATICYEMLTGRNPGQGAYRPASELCAGLSSEFDMVVERAREANPDDRYPTIQAFLDDLRCVTFAQPSSSHAPAATKEVDRLTRAARQSVERGWPIWLIVSVLLGFGVGAIVHYTPAIAIARYTAATMTIMVATAVLARPLTAFYARRARATEIALLGPLLGMILGAANAYLFLRGVKFSDVVDPWLLGTVKISTYSAVLVASTLESLVVAMAVFLMASGGNVLRRVGWGRGRTYLVIYFVLVGAIVLLSLIMPRGLNGSFSAPYAK